MESKPQEIYKIHVNNDNLPFDHPHLSRSDAILHLWKGIPQETLWTKQLTTTHGTAAIEQTPLLLVGEVENLSDLAAQLENVDMFAVDLEHNQYRSFQGLTCLMQISTKDKDFIVDTLKLRDHIGPYLRGVFMDAEKKKVMHGAGMDVLWLQRDFGIYICNLFDTAQASKVLSLERNSLKHLLQVYCGVTTDKKYQAADWRVRPLPDEMIRYAREDTHYLLYIFEVMKKALQSTLKETDNSDTALLEVYKRSYQVCKQLYEKPIWTPTSHLYIYGLNEAGLNDQQLSIVSGLSKWRDHVARTEDESTGYVLPNKALLRIAKHIPRTEESLHKLLSSGHPIAEQNVSTILSIIEEGHAIEEEEEETGTEPKEVKKSYKDILLNK